jgi:hypothetical protein
MLPEGEFSSLGHWEDNEGEDLSRVGDEIRFGKVRHRSDVVEYRVENHREALGDRLTTLEKLTTRPFFSPDLGIVRFSGPDDDNPHTG